MSRVVIDFEQLEETIREYDQSIEAFESLLKHLEGTVQELKDSGWASEAGKTYFEQFDESWKCNMKKHILVMQHIKRMMEKMKFEFEALNDEVINLRNYL